MKHFPIRPMGAVRMTHYSKNTDERALAYHQWKGQMRMLAQGWKFPASGAKVTFEFEMPASWSKAKKDRMCRAPHQSTPDLDNCLKALIDALCDARDGGDSYVWNVYAEKYWARENGIMVYEEL